MTGLRGARHPWLAAALGCGLLLRLGNLERLRHSPLFDQPVLDGIFCVEWAMHIVSGTAPAAPFYQDPLYPHLLAGIFGVFGPGYWPVYALQALLGLLVVVMVHDMTRLTFGRRAAAVAAFIAAVYKPFLFYEGQIEKTSVAVAVTAVFLWALVRSLRSQAAGWAALAGAGLGLACLSRGNLLVFTPLLPVALLTGGPGPWRANRAKAVAAAAATLVVLAPVGARNSRLGGGFLVTNAQLGQNLYAGNGPFNHDGQNGTPPWVRTSPEFEQGDFAGYARQALGRDLTPAEVSRYFVGESLRWVRQNPAAFLRLTVKKVLLYLNAFEVPDNTDIDFFARYTPILRLPLPGFSLVLALAFPWLLLRGPRHGPRGALAGFSVLFALAVTSFFVLSRFRAPAISALLPFAGGAAAFLGRAARRRSAVRAPLRITLFAGAGALAVSLLPVDRIPARRSAAQALTNLGARHYREGDLPGAERFFVEALAEDPTLVGALRSLGVLLVQRGDSESAADFLERAVAVDPGDAVARHYLGRVRESRGQHQAALAQFEAAADLAPWRADFTAARDRARARLAPP